MIIIMYYQYYFGFLLLLAILALLYDWYTNQSFEKITTAIDCPPPEPIIEQDPVVIVSFRGEKYDITDFVNHHPGGKKILLQNNGKEVAELMKENEHSEKAYQILEKYKVRL